jgi:hypothetical protein
MINTSKPPDIMKRKLLALLASVPWFTGCSASSGNVSTDPEDVRLRQKFRGIYGGVLRVDAATLKEYVTITTEAGWQISGAGSLSLVNVTESTYTGNSMPIPKAVRAIWRQGNVSLTTKGWKGGTIVGDYTVPVAQRIPDDILDYIRKNGGALRLKIRLKDDGILIGWDVEKIVPYKGWKPGDGPTGIHYLMPGGDFREAQVYNGKVTDPGWQK